MPCLSGAKLDCICTGKEGACFEHHAYLRLYFGFMISRFLAQDTKDEVGRRPMTSGGFGCCSLCSFFFLSPSVREETSRRERGEVLAGQVGYLLAVGLLKGEIPKPGAHDTGQMGNVRPTPLGQ